MVAHKKFHQSANTSDPSTGAPATNQCTRHMGKKFHKGVLFAIFIQILRIHIQNAEYNHFR